MLAMKRMWRLTVSLNLLTPVMGALQISCGQGRSKEGSNYQ